MSGGNQSERKLRKMVRQRQVDDTDKRRVE